MSVLSEQPHPNIHGQYGIGPASSGTQQQLSHHCDASGADGALGVVADETAGVKGGVGWGCAEVSQPSEVMLSRGHERA